MILLFLGFLFMNLKCVKIIFFYVEKVVLKKKDGWKDNKNVYFKNIYWGVYMLCI